ncbi:spermidine synthase [bacterium]|nr:MAG: spermidine synthase [bacterium]RKZ27455.1 MAG: spermidine synthase [bacterium]
MDEGSIYCVDNTVPHLLTFYRIERVLAREKTPFQLCEIVELVGMGKALFLDGAIQSCEADEFIYHECLVHPAMFVHPHPERVYIGGGGEGATLREVLKHNTVKKAVMVDIDRRAVELCMEHLPEFSAGAFEDKRAEVVYDDARKVLKQYENFDVIILDLTEPMEDTPSQYLYTLEFYKEIYEKLTENGVFVTQAGSTAPFYNALFASIIRTLKEIFPYVYGMEIFVGSFQMPWGLVLASKKEDPMALSGEEIKKRMEERGVGELRLYSPSYHHALLTLPPHLANLEGKVLTEKEPFRWGK